MKAYRFLDPILAIGVLISIVISMILLALGVETIPTLTFGLFGLILSMQIDLSARIAEQESKLLSALGLSKVLFRDDEFRKYMTNILNAWNTLLTAKTHPLLSQQAKVSIQDFHSRLVGIEAGEVITDASDVRPLTVVIDEARKEINAISLISLDWWNSHIGEKYWKRNLDALVRGCKITRIFVVSGISPSMKSLMLKMHEAGVLVKVVKQNEVPEDLCQATVIADGNLVWTSILDSKDMPRHNHFSTKLEHLQQASERFQKLSQFADEFTELT